MNHPIPRTTGQAACVAVVTTGLLAACAVGPNFKAPEAPRNAGFAPPGQIAPETTAAPLPGGQAQRFVDGMDIPGQWWTLFQSAQLNALIERGLKNSPTLQAAQAALRQANETTAAQRGSYYPSLAGTAQSERQKGSGASFGIPGLPSSYYYNLQTASVNVSYTLDAFGGTRRQVEALQAQAEYQQFALEASYLTLTANIVAAAVNQASLRAQISATEDIARSQQMQLDITQRRFAAGATSRADVLQQQSILQDTLATLPPLRTQGAQQSNSAAVLINVIAKVGDDPVNMLPQITLSGSYGQTASKWANIFSPSSNIYSLIGSLTQPIFKGGQLMHQRRAAVAAAQEAAANYQATVINAFENVSNTLYALQSDADTLAAQATAERSAADSLGLVQAQYKSGGASYVQVLTSEQSYQNAAVALVKARAQRYADTAALFQALGGGWWNRSEALADISTTPRSQQAQ